MTDAEDKEKAEKLAAGKKRVCTYSLRISCFLEFASASLSADLSFNHIVRATEKAERKGEEVRFSEEEG